MKKQEISGKSCTGKAAGKSSKGSSSQLSISALHLAVLDGDYSLVESILSQKVDVDSSGDMGWSPLRYACTRGDVKMCKLLIQYGASVNPPKGDRKWTALHATAGLDQIECLKYLVEETEASAKVQNMDGFTPLHVAVVYGNNISSVRLLLKHGKGVADIEQEDDAGNTALALACKNHRLEGIKVLLFEFYADPFSPSLKPAEYDDCVRDLIDKSKKEESSKNKAWSSMLKVGRLLLLLKHEMASSELQLMTLAHLNSKYLSKTQTRILSDTFLDRRSIGELGSDNKRQPRLFEACQKYLDS